MLKLFQIFEIKTSDCRPLIAKVCQNLYQERHLENNKNILNDRNSLLEYLNKNLNQNLHNNFTEPDLCIIFNEFTCTYGLLPWHTRFTEFYTHHNDKIFNAESFTDALYKFSKCEQRWGK